MVESSGGVFIAYAKVGNICSFVVRGRELRVLLINERRDAFTLVELKYLD